MIHRWIEFWNRREAPTSLVVVRILVSVAILTDLMMARALGVVDAVWAPPPLGTGYGALGDSAPLLVRLFGASTATTGAVWACSLVAAFMVGVGLFTRVAAVAFVFLSAQLAHIAPDADRGIDTLFRIVVAVLALSACNAKWSLDAWMRRRMTGRSVDLVPAWPRYLLFAQLVWMYFSAGVNKRDRAWGPEGDFSALASILSDPHFARFDSGWVASLYPITQAATCATMMFEYGAPVFLAACILAQRAKSARLAWAARGVRWLWLIAGASFHVGIAASMRLGVFPYGMLAIWPVFFSPDELSRARARLSSLGQGRVQDETSATI